MAGHIFNIQDDGTLIEMNEQAFETENIFQTLLEKYPNLLAGDQINSTEPRRWLLIKREIGIPGEELGSDRWSLDHLFLDQDAIPTLIEVKRSSDTRIRREVVGQMFEYAANAVAYWSIEQVIREFERQCDIDGVDSSVRLQAFLADDDDPDEFWRRVKTNLQAGKIRMLFVADVIPAELRRIVEFVNAQMDPAEVLAVEIKHFVGPGLKTLVPRVIGQTAEAEGRKSTGRSTNRKPPLTLAELQSIADENGVGNNYRDLVGALTPLFSQTKTSRSTIGFYDSLESGTSSVVVISLSPVDAASDKGCQFAFHVDRCAAVFGVDRQELIESLPNCDVELNPEYSGEIRRGYSAHNSDLQDLLTLLKQANRQG